MAQEETKEIKKKTSTTNDAKKPEGKGAQGRKRNRNDKPDDGVVEEVLEIKRVSKKTTGGNAISFTALVVVGDMNGRVGLGLGRGIEVPQAIKKGVKKARKSMITVPLYEGTIPHDIMAKFKSSRLLLKPAPKGTGLKVGSVVRTILTLAGVHNASGKMLGSRNKTTNAYGVMHALRNLQPRN